MGSERQAVEPCCTPHHSESVAQIPEKNRHPLALRKRTEKSRAGGRRIDERVRKIVEEEIAKYACGKPTIEGCAIW